MAISCIVNVSDHATAALEKLNGALEPRALFAEVGAAEELLFKAHFDNAPTNKFGYPSTGFWKSASRATNWHASSQGVVINVNKVGVRQRLEGGEIHPVNAAHLAIPARAEAYGKTPSEFDNLQVAFRRIGGRAQAFALVEAAATQISYGKKRKGTRDFTTTSVGGGVYFWLVNSVYQTPDPDAIPADADIREEAREAISNIVQRIGGVA